MNSSTNDQVQNLKENARRNFTRNFNLNYFNEKHQLIVLLLKFRHLTVSNFYISGENTFVKSQLFPHPIILL